MRMMSNTQQKLSSDLKNPNPKVILFMCRWCSGKGADLAGVSRLHYPSNILPVLVNCSSRIDPQHVVEAFLNGADGVMVTGCHFGDCHYRTGNYKTYRRMSLLSRVFDQIGISPKRFKLTWISATEGVKFAKETTEFVEELKKLPPYHENSINGGNEK